MPELSENPLSYIDWAGTRDFTVTDESKLFNLYSVYVTDWYKSKGREDIEVQNQIEQLYLDLLQEITLNYTTVDERRFLSNLDYSNKKELDIIIPFYAKKLKQITQYCVRKRTEVKSSKIKHSYKGSQFGIHKIVTDIFVDLLSNDDFTEKYPTSYIPAVSAFIDKLINRY